MFEVQKNSLISEAIKILFRKSILRVFLPLTIRFWNEDLS